MPVEVGECGLLWGACWWDALAALGTVLAVAVSLVLAVAAWIKSSREAKKAAQRESEVQARMVSAWVEAHVEPSPNGRRYVRHATLNMENQSEQPVFMVYVEVGIPQPNDTWLNLGPLAAPVPVRVLPPKTKRSWDISLALMTYGEAASSVSGDIAVSTYFTDPSDRRWSRAYTGGLELQQSKAGKSRDLMQEVGGDSNQLGPDDFSNPVFVVTLFFGALFALSEGEKEAFAGLKELLDPSANGWAQFDVEAWLDLARRYEDYGIAAFVHYPAPRVAYVKILPDEEASKRLTGEVGYVEVSVSVITLRYLIGQGWRIFGIGIPSPADLVGFPEGDLHSDVIDVDSSGL